MQNENLFQLLSQRGLDSKYKEPFVFDDGKKCGFYYSFLHPSFGLINRAVSFLNVVEAEQFLNQFLWYQEHAKDYGVTIELSDYQAAMVNPSFVLNDKNLSFLEMQTLSSLKDDLGSQKRRKKRYYRYLRTARILIDILILKVKYQNDTYRSAKEMSNEYKRQENEFWQLYNRYQKTNHPLHPIEPDKIEEVHMESEITSLKERVTYFYDHEGLEIEVHDFIDSLWKNLLELETDERLLQNKYLLVRYPFDLELIRKKKNYLENVVNKKKGLFSKKENVDLELKQIESTSEKLVLQEDYIANEKKRLEEKYAMIEDMDFTTLGDYLNEFDNLGIVPPEDQKNQMDHWNQEQIQSYCQEQFQKYSLEDQAILQMYSSFLQPLCDLVLNQFIEDKGEDEILKIILPDHLDEVLEYVEILNHVSNIEIRKTYFSMLPSNNPTGFVRQLIAICKKLFSISMISISSPFVVYGRSDFSGFSKTIYHASLESLFAPIQPHQIFRGTDIISLPESMKVFYFPIYIGVDPNSLEDDMLKVYSKREYFMFFCQNYQVLENNDIMKVSRFQKTMEHGNQKNIVTRLSLLNEDLYRNVTLLSQEDRS